MKTRALLGIFRECRLAEKMTHSLRKTFAIQLLGQGGAHSCHPGALQDKLRAVEALVPKVDERDVS